MNQLATVHPIASTPQSSRRRIVKRAAPTIFTDLPDDAFKPSLTEYLEWQRALLFGAVGIINEIILARGRAPMEQVVAEMVQRLSKIGAFPAYRLRYMISSAARQGAFRDYNLNVEVGRGFVIRAASIPANDASA